MGRQKTQPEREIALRVGARIRQLREIQHISQVRLATEIGIRAGPLGWIEKGKHLPSGRVLYRIARQLNVRLDDLFQEKDVWQVAATESVPVLYPPLGVEEVTEPVKSAHIVCQSVADKLAVLSDGCGSSDACGLALPPPCFPSEAGAQCAAAQVRQRLGIGVSIMADYVEVLEDAGAWVIFLEMPDGCDSFGGYDRQNRCPVIFVNSRLKKQPERQLFRVVFELGRVCWHAGKTGGSGARAEAIAMDELQFSNRFAVHFLMPEQALQTAVLQFGGTPAVWPFEVLLRLKKRYGVTAQALADRLDELCGCWSDKQKRNSRNHLFKEELDAFAEKNGAGVEPGGSRPPLGANGRLCTLLLYAEQAFQKDLKALNAIKRLLRQAGVKLDA